MISIVLYSRPGCHLCEDAKGILLNAQPVYNFELVEKNIDEDEELFDKYCVDIPVVTVNGAFFGRYQIDARELKDKLELLMKENDQ